MKTPALIFGANCAIAALLALLVAFSFELPNPSWAVITVFITSQPILRGAVWGKAFYRVVGTVVALTVALVMIPNLIDAPELMMLALALWIGVCLFVSLLDRTPRSYAFMLSGYTTALVGLPVIVADPSTIFDTAIARTEEILIGVGSAALVHGIFSLHSARRAFLAKLGQILADARNWVTGAVAGSASPEERSARRRLAADIADLLNLGIATGVEAPELHARAGVIRALEDRLVTLLPLLSAIESRREALLEFGALDARIESLAQQVCDWIAAPTADDGAFQRLLQSCETFVPHLHADSTQKTLLEFNFVHRLALLAHTWRDCTDLARAVNDPHAPIDPRFARAIAHPAARALHVDPVIALWSASVAAVSVAVSAALGMLLEWPPAVTTIALAAVLSSLFATFDDPTPPQLRLLAWSLIAIPVSAVYVFAVLPLADGFVELALCLGPLYFAFGFFMAQPKYALQSLSVMLVSSTLIGVQPAYRADFVSFASIAAASVLGMVIAIVITQLLRIVGADISTRRLLRSAWADLASLARSPQRNALPSFAMRMLDRLNLLTPRASRATPGYELYLGDVLRDLQIGFNLSELDAAVAEIPDASRRSLHALRLQLGTYFEALSEGAGKSSQAPSIESVDAVVHELLALLHSPLRDRAIAAVVGLRQNLLSLQRQADAARGQS